MIRLASLRYRLLSLVLVPLVLLSGTVIALASSWSSDYTYKQLFAKVSTDLRVAGDGFSVIQENGQRRLSSFANSVQLSKALDSGDLARLNELISIEIALGEFDFLNLLSGNGRQVLSKNQWQPHRIRDSLLSKQILAARTMTTLSGIEIYSAPQWQQQHDLDSVAVILPLVETARAAPTSRKEEDRAMVIRTLQSVYDQAGNRMAILEAGLLLNRNFAFVDRIRDLVYGPGTLPQGSQGTVTVFLDDVRITTNVMMSNNSRALGTRVSKEVRNAVLERGQTWVDRAYVVNDWYISAYEPIVNVAGDRVGMLYAGYLEAPFRSDLFKAIAVLSAVVLAGSLAAAVAAILGARSIFAPIEAIASVVRATARGEHRRIGPITTGNEIGELALQFDAMLDNLDSHRQRIENDALLLEENVRQRTQELELQNARLQESIQLLQQTRRQLATAEKLAALGELTAGVAHEINNPTAVILGNMDVLVEDLGSRRHELQTEIDLIIEQVYRIRSITERLLQYSRAAQQQHVDGRNPFDQEGGGAFSDPPQCDVLQFAKAKMNLPTVQLGELVGNTLTLLSHELSGRNIIVSQCHTARMKALIDRQEFQQVLINLISNAIQAIGHDGEITVRTEDLSDQKIRLRVGDTGRGIETEHLPQIFDPFFTVGKVKGTGLGLSVSYGIVRRYGGDIAVSSELAKGSLFTVTLWATA